MVVTQCISQVGSQMGEGQKCKLWVNVAQMERRHFSGACVLYLCPVDLPFQPLHC